MLSHFCECTVMYYSHAFKQLCINCVILWMYRDVLQSCIQIAVYQLWQSVDVPWRTTVMHSNSYVSIVTFCWVQNIIKLYSGICSCFLWYCELLCLHAVEFIVWQRICYYRHVYSWKILCQKSQCGITLTSACMAWVCTVWVILVLLSFFIVDTFHIPSIHQLLKLL